MTDLRYASGVYVAGFPERVKIGLAAAGLRARLRQHLTAGATQLVCWPLWQHPGPGAEAWQIERYALHLAAQQGRQLGRSESFAELSYDAAAACVDTAITARRGGPAYRVVPDLTWLATYLPMPWERTQK